MYKKLTVDPAIRAKHNELLDQPVIVVVTTFNDEGVKNFREDMEKAHHTGQPLIPVLIDSYGGSVYGCLDMVSHLKKSELPVHADWFLTAKEAKKHKICTNIGIPELKVHVGVNYTFE